MTNFKLNFTKKIMQANNTRQVPNGDLDKNSQIEMIKGEISGMARSLKIST